MKRRLQKEIGIALSRHGISIVEVYITSRHGKLKISNGRVTAMLYTSLSPSDNRAMLNIVKTAKRALAEAEGVA